MKRAKGYYSGTQTSTLGQGRRKSTSRNTANTTVLLGGKRTRRGENCVCRERRQQLCKIS